MSQNVSSAAVVIGALRVKKLHGRPARTTCKHKRATINQPAKQHRMAFRWRVNSSPRTLAD